MAEIDYNRMERISLRGFSDLGNGKFGFQFKIHYGALFFTEFMGALYEVQRKCYDLDAEVHSFKCFPGYSLEGGLSSQFEIIIKSKRTIWEDQT